MTSSRKRAQRATTALVAPSTALTTLPSLTPPQTPGFKNPSIDYWCPRDSHNRNLAYIV